MLNYELFRAFHSLQFGLRNISPNLMDAQ